MIGLVFLGFWGCEPKEDPPLTPQEDLVEEAIYTTMKEWYFWNQ